jgi:hypothetical protein
MKTKREPLLEAILEEDGFREALLAKTLHQVRRNNRLLQFKRMAAVLIAVVVIPFLALKPAKQISPPQAASVHRPYELVLTQPLRESLLVRSRPNNFTIAPVASVHLETVTSASSRGLFQQINDEQLFALLAGHPAALVWHNSAQPELLFLNKDDQRRLVHE